MRRRFLRFTAALALLAAIPASLSSPSAATAGTCRLECCPNVDSICGICCTPGPCIQVWCP